MKKNKKVAIVGAGISGLSAAWLLNNVHDITLYEKTGKVGGHAYTHDLMIDLGVVIVAERASATFFELIKMLDIDTRIVTLSFSAEFENNISWSNYQCASEFWQEIKPECDRFMMDMNSISNSSNLYLDYSLGKFLMDKNYSKKFIHGALIPFLSVIAACRASLLETNIKNCALYFSNHRFSFFNPTLFRAFPSGTQAYTSKLAEQLSNKTRLQTPVESILRKNNSVILTDNLGHQEEYDEVIIATQANIACDLLKDITETEQQVLKMFHYEDATTVLHTDESFLTTSRNKHLIHYKSFVHQETSQKGSISIDVNYYAEQLEMTPLNKQYIVTIQPVNKISADKIIDIKEWQHTANQVDLPVIRKNIGNLQGKNHTWFCGADTSFAAHGYACASGLAIAEALGAEYPFLDKPWVSKEHLNVKNIMGLK